MKEENILLTRNGIAIAVLQLGLGVSGSLFFPFIEPLLFDLGASYTLITFRRTFVALASLFTSWVWGALSDFFQSHKSLMTFGFGTSVVFCIPFLFFHSLVYSPLFLLFSLAFFSLFRSMVFPVRNSVVTLISKEESGGANLGYIYTIFYLGWGGGSLFFGYMIEAGHLIRAFFLTALLSYLALSAFYLLFQDEKVEVKGKVEVEKKNILEMLAEVEKPLLILALAIFLLGISRNIFFSLFKIKLYVAYGRNYGLLGLVTTISGVGGAAATMLYGKSVDRFGGFTIFVVGALMCMGFYFTLAFSSNPLIITIPWILPVASLLTIPAVSITGRLSEEKKRGRAQGLVSGIRRIAGVGTVIGGITADYVGNIDLIFLGLTPFPVISILILYVLLRKEKRE
ncbi:MAG: MFS transporter [Candidatus Korarchaeota archaeon]|nr:MFS transporter [Candidatus Korarchaeota archaeon]NIU85683.1 MFS transporter [Candidatus Thorarchaeota archaeon]NIW15778.1 MFS transporter [Candidatus Thorarchaeota archaeon]NIW53692.1 MFS transporter [Candidatus Korarchaeota archaeon]